MNESNEHPQPSVQQTLSGWSLRNPGRITFELSHVEAGPQHPPQSTPFIVDKTPHVMWDHSLAEKNLEFLKGIDSGYFRHVAEIHFPILKSGDREARLRSATALRMDYSLALETFCALVATAVQSPRFALGWMLRYKNQDLESVIRKLHAGAPVNSAWPNPFSWRQISEAILTAPVEDRDEQEQIHKGFARAWEQFAAEFIDQAGVAEYNSLKHGWERKWEDSKSR